MGIVVPVDTRTVQEVVAVVVLLRMLLAEILVAVVTFLMPAQTLMGSPAGRYVRLAKIREENE